MSVVDSFGDPERTPRATQLAHWVMPIMVIATPTVILGGLEVIPQWIGLPVLLVAVVTLVTARLHWTLGRICVKCMQEVPADAGPQSEQKRWMLRGYHVSMRLWFNVVWLTVFLGGPLIVGLAFGRVASNWANTPLWLLLLGEAYVTLQHHRLQPWCPYCRRWDDHGPREPSPDPAPYIEKVR